MSRYSERFHTARVELSEKLPSFAERFTSAGFTLPDQSKMKLMMRATAMGMPWSSSLTQVELFESRFSSTGEFAVFSLGEYAEQDDMHFGAPMPPEVVSHINEVQKKFPEADIRIHAHPKDDPFVEISMDGESFFTKAWRRMSRSKCEIYPRYV